MRANVIDLFLLSPSTRIGQFSSVGPDAKECRNRRRGKGDGVRPGTRCSRSCRSYSFNGSDSLRANPKADVPSFEMISHYCRP